MPFCASAFFIGCAAADEHDSRRTRPSGSRRRLYDVKRSASLTPMPRELRGRECSHYVKAAARGVRCYALCNTYSPVTSRTVAKNGGGPRFREVSLGTRVHLALWYLRRGTPRRTKLHWLGVDGFAVSSSAPIRTARSCRKDESPTRSRAAGTGFGLLEAAHLSVGRRLGRVASQSAACTPSRNEETREA